MSNLQRAGLEYSAFHHTPLISMLTLMLWWIGSWALFIPFVEIFSARLMLILICKLPILLLYYKGFYLVWAGSALIILFKRFDSAPSTSWTVFGGSDLNFSVCLWVEEVFAKRNLWLISEILSDVIFPFLDTRQFGSQQPCYSCWLLLEIVPLI